MGRGGYNGGSSSLNSPKKEKIIVFPTDSTLQDLQLATILESGCNLTNELGGIQPEFGYLIRKTKEPTQGIVEAGNKDKKRLSDIVSFKKGKRKKSGKKNRPTVSAVWIAGSTLLETCPELVRIYHSENPVAARPYGYSESTSTSDSDDGFCETLESFAVTEQA